ncbi:hypothetical protein DRE_05399 [Drechslerella stenobrocha 248]|uniref:Sec20 C-terminal domain-containing protein n=1 Tax=Drechslerella stenobrocha 248 TaxID=1043628 RepID=W7HND3_9PEZI|nr:hypothetical protein DRE_05399 [Drechslerella stenobrocha 248]
MSTASSEISKRIALLTTAYHELTAQIERLAGLTAPGTEEARGELAGLIQHSLKEGEAELETLSLRIATLNPSTDPQAALEARLHKLRDEFKIARMNARKALLNSKRASALAGRQQRQTIPAATTASITTSPTETENTQPTSPSSAPISGAQLYRRPYHSTASRTDKTKGSTEADMLATASGDVTAALRRTHALMSAELNRSSFAHETLSQSTAALRELSTSYSAFEGALRRGKGLITTLVRKNKSDMWYYQMSLYALVGTIAWLVFRRLLWGPVWLLVWLPLRMLVWGLLLLFGGGGGGEKAVVGGAGAGVGVSESVMAGADDVKRTVEKVVESMTVAEKVGDNVHGQDYEEGVKEILLDSGEVVQVPLAGEGAVHDEL